MVVLTLLDFFLIVNETFNSFLTVLCKDGRLQLFYFKMGTRNNWHQSPIPEVKKRKKPRVE